MSKSLQLQIKCLFEILLMEEIRPNQLINSLSHYLQGFIHPRWLLGISSINRITCWSKTTRIMNHVSARISKFCTKEWPKQPQFFGRSSNKQKKDSFYAFHDHTSGFRDHKNSKHATRTRTQLLLYQSLKHVYISGICFVLNKPCSIRTSIIPGSHGTKKMSTCSDAGSNIQ